MLITFWALVVSSFLTFTSNIFWIRVPFRRRMSPMLWLLVMMLLSDFVTFRRLFLILSFNLQSDEQYTISKTLSCRAGCEEKNPHRSNKITKPKYSFPGIIYFLLPWYLLFWLKSSKRCRNQYFGNLPTWWYIRRFILLLAFLICSWLLYDCISIGNLPTCFNLSHLVNHRGRITKSMLTELRIIAIWTGLFFTRARASCSLCRIKSKGSEWSFLHASLADWGFSSNKAPGTDGCCCWDNS